MTNNPTIDGVSRELLERLLTEACNENWSDLNELLHAPAACRCRRFGKDNPHWPCPVHSAQAEQLQGDQHDPTATMTEAGCQAYMDADGMIGIMHNSSMGHAYVAMRALDPEFATLQSTIAQLQARIVELESARGEPFKTPEMPYKMLPLEEDGWFQCIDAYEAMYPLFTAPPAPIAAVDENAEFEKWAIGYYGVENDEELNFKNPDVKATKVGWIARACLDATAVLNNKP